MGITEDDDGRYCLLDSASMETASEAVIRPTYPWSLAIPMRNHFIETMDVIRPVPAEITGIGELEDGSTFIIDDRCNDA